MLILDIRWWRDKDPEDIWTGISFFRHTKEPEQMLLKEYWSFHMEIRSFKFCIRRKIPEEEVPI